MTVAFTIIGIVAYILINCASKKLNVVEYITTNKVTLLLTAGAVVLIHLFGAAASAASMMAMLTPIMAAYSIPSLLAKLKAIWLRFYAWITELGISEPNDVE